MSKLQEFFSSPRNLGAAVIVLAIIASWSTYQWFAWRADATQTRHDAGQALIVKQAEITRLQKDNADIRSRLSESRRDIGDLADKLAAKSGTLGKTQARLAREQSARARAELRSEGSAKTARAAVEAAAKVKREAKK